LKIGPGFVALGIAVAVFIAQLDAGIVEAMPLAATTFIIFYIPLRMIWPRRKKE
jgi:hypothetical protein